MSDSACWTALGWECPTGRVSFYGILDSHCVLAGYLSSRVDKVLCSGSKVLCSVPKSYVQVAKSYVQVAKSYVQVAKSYVQVGKSYVQVAKFSSSVFL